MVLPLGNTEVLINGQPAIRLADQARCPPGQSDVVSEGAASARMGGLPAAAVAHGIVHGPTIVTSSGDVNIGGPKFALPKNLHVFGDADYRNKVIRDMWLLSQTPWGREMFDRLERTGASVTILPAPMNANRPGFVYYDPDAIAVTEGRSGGAVNAPPQTALGHELAHAVRVAEGKASGNPTKEQFMAEEEIVRGTGARAYSETLSENSLRKDLGVPQRGESVVKREEQSGPIDGPENLRPGGY